MASPTIQLKRGLLANLPGLQAGEPGFTTDSYDLYVGIDSTTANNKFFGSHRYWTRGTASTGSGVNFVEGTTNGTQYITLKAPDSLSGITTFNLPSADGTNGQFLKTNGSGTLSFADVSTNLSIAGGTGTDTVSLLTDTLTFAGTANEIETAVTNNQVQIGLPDNIIVGGALTVTGSTQLNGTVNLGNATGDKITVVGLTTFTTSDVYISNSLYVSGIQITGSTGTVIGEDIVSRNFKATGVSTFVGAVTFEGGTITLGDSATDNVVFAADVNSNIVPNTDATYDFGTGSQRWRNASFSGIVTSSGLNINGDIKASRVDSSSEGGQVSFGRASDNATAWYVDVYGSTSTPSFRIVDVSNSAIRAVIDGSGNFGINNASPTSTLDVTGDAKVSGVVTATTFIGTLTGTASTATRATLVDTTSTSTNADYYATFVDTLSGQTGETLRTGIGLSINPSTGNVGVSSILSVGNVNATNAYIKAGGGSNAIYLSSNGDVLFQGKVVTNSIRSHSSASDALTLSGRDVTFGNNVVVTGIVTATTFDGNLALADITGLGANVATFLATPSSANLAAAVTDETGSGALVFATSPTLVTPVLGAASATSLEVSGAVNVGTALSAPTIKTATVQHSNGTQAATIDTSGNITATQNLTISGNLYVNGSTTQVNTAALTVEDRTIELGVVDGSSPSSTTTWDLGVLFNYYDGSAKKSALVWEQGDARFKLGSVISDGGGTGNTNPQITFTTYAPLEIGALWVNDCAGQSQVISCSGSIRKLENITIDGGTF